MLRFHLDRMIAREAGTRLGEDPEELHKMRVATRRMRAAWRVFGDGFRGERTKRHRGHLRVIATRLGAVRDRDVLLEGLERYRATASERDREAIEPLADHWRTEREVARIELMEELDSERYLRWLEDFRAFAGSPGTALAPWRPATPHRVRDTSASRLWEAYEQIRAYEAVLRWADIATLHQLRIAAKRLRYTLEFLRETLPPEAGEVSDLKLFAKRRYFLGGSRDTTYFDRLREFQARISAKVR